MQTRVISAEKNKVTVCGDYSEMFTTLENVLTREGVIFTIWDQSITDLEVQFKDGFRILINIKVLDFCLWLFTFTGGSLGATDTSQSSDNKAQGLATSFSYGLANNL